MDSEARPSTQSDDAPVVSEPAPDPVFSDLISRWLDEGDRLGQGAAPPDTGAPVGRAAVLARRWAPQLERLREIVDRHRVLVLAGLGLIPMALFLATHRTPPAPAAPAMVARAAPPAVRPTAVVALESPSVRATRVKPVAPPVHRQAPRASTARSGKQRAKAKKVAMAKRHPVVTAKVAPAHPHAVAAVAKAPAPRRPAVASAPKVVAPAQVASAPKGATPVRQPASPKAPHVAVIIPRR